MTRILLVGYDPEAMDFSDPALPPGMTADVMEIGITRKEVLRKTLMGMG